MTKTEAIRYTWELVNKEMFTEAFEFGYDHDIFVAEDWITENGIEYYVVTVEDDQYKTIVE